MSDGSRARSVVATSTAWLADGYLDRFVLPDVDRRPMQSRLILLLAALVLPAALAHARCGNQPGDATALADARAAVEASCQCGAGQTHGAYVSCATRVARERVAAGQLPRRCRGKVTACAARSTCGKSASVTCCLTRGRRTRCKVLSPARCAELGGCAKTQASCCDACTTSGCASGATCSANPTGGPSQVSLTVLDSGTDLDLGWTGTIHNRTVPAGWTLDLCLSGCNATDDPTCDALGPTGPGQLNGSILGTPLPILGGGRPMCIVHRFAGDVQGTANVATGAIDATLSVLAEVYATGPTWVCPRCENGRCRTADGPGDFCTVHGTVEVPEALASNKTFQLSRDCLPEGSALRAIELSLPLTTGTAGTPATGGSLPCRENEALGVPVKDDNCGTAGCGATCTPGSHACATMAPDPSNPEGPEVCVGANGGASQLCCRDNATVPCFPTRDASIVRSGRAVAPTPPWPDSAYPKAATGTVLVATECYPATGSSGIDLVSGLPGPAALMLNTRAEWTAP
jgi:hypothetical protein